MTEKPLSRDEGAQQDAAVQPAPRILTPEAMRALAEAEERRRKADADARAAAPEINGRGGLDPARYGDWEVKGIISDF